MKSIFIHVTGTVQGVGFRPFVYVLASSLHLTGSVCNNSEGVFIEVQGEEKKIEEFLSHLKKDAPPASIVEKITVIDIKPLKAATFQIIASSTSEGTTNISPDLALCKDCREDILSTANHRYHYAFTNCTNCGPRYSIIEEMPYDRKNTAMHTFTMCTACDREYHDPLDRRFHAQPNACPLCGPSLLLEIGGKVFHGSDEEKICTVRKLIQEGKIVAIKGIGGFHLAVDANNAQAIKKLREKKNRPTKAFALMADSLTTIEKIAHVSEEEKKLLLSSASPIVLLRRKNMCVPSKLIAPDTLDIGIMLPYTPLHLLLLPQNGLWIMTSANASSEPMLKDNREAREKLAAISDAILYHTRDIVHRIDDSVVKIVGKKPLFLRRARGYAPSPLSTRVLKGKNMPSVLAGGSELKNTFCLTCDQNAYLSEHIGDLTNISTIATYEEKISTYQKFFAKKIDLLAVDAHPLYHATQSLKKYAHEKNIPLVAVQHHHAHIASVLLEKGEREKVLGIAFDGTGYGDDGTIWGGEFLVASMKEYQRVAHFTYLPLPGGDIASKEVWRLGLLMLDKIFSHDRTKLRAYLAKHFPEEAVTNHALILEMTEKNINTPRTSSVGRLFDLASTLLGISFFNSYEGASAIRLEKYARLAQNEGKILPYEIREKEFLEIDLFLTFKKMVEEKEQGRSIKDLALDFHMTLGEATFTVSKKLLEKYSLKKVALSGGVMQNTLLLENLTQKFQNIDIPVLRNEKVPPNDGGIAFGEVAVALSQHQEKK